MTSNTGEGTSRGVAVDHQQVDDARARAIATARGRIDEVVEVLGRRVAHRTESQGGGNREAALGYLRDEIAPALKELGFEPHIGENPASANHPVLIARRIEDPSLPTVLLYGHGDVQFGHDEHWSDGRDPWNASIEDGKVYGRGTADNKGQHTVNIAALQTVIRARRELGYNITFLVEMGEESGSIGLEAVADRYAEQLGAELFVGSDGPRISAEVPTIFLGSRGALNFNLRIRDRDGDLHSGNWGGKVRNPATVLASAVSAIVGSDGVIKPDFLRPPGIPDDVRQAVAALPTSAEDSGSTVDEGWGEPGLTPAERVFAWNTVEVLALLAGDAAEPKNAIPAEARAVMQIRYVVGTDVSDFVGRMETWLGEHGIHGVEVSVEHHMPATRLDPSSTVVGAAEQSIAETTGAAPAIEPNLGGTIPNAVFAEQLRLPTVWIPHSHPGCNQHAPDEHALISVLEEGLGIMAGVFWDMSADPNRWFSSGQRSARS